MVDAVPLRLRRHGRPVDAVFDPGEELYRRVRIADLLPDRRLNPVSLDLPRCSVNRQKCSDDPLDVLIPHWGFWGCVKWTVADVPAVVEVESSGTLLRGFFRVEHVPEDDCYAHSEVRSFRDRNLADPQKPSRLVRKIARQMIADRTNLVKEPDE